MHAICKQEPYTLEKIFEIEDILKDMIKVQFYIFLKSAVGGGWKLTMKNLDHFRLIQTIAD